MSSSIDQFLNSRGFYYFEGYSQQVPQQVADLIRLTAGENIRSVMEIGFNAGHSADVFLKNNNNISLTSFDLGSHNYLLTGKEYIDTTYPNRHMIILGNSVRTVPTFNRNNPTTKFDVIFIDGGHT